jgi:uncharacterized protein YecA (UPF0149 family)
VRAIARSAMRAGLAAEPERESDRARHEDADPEHGVARLDGVDIVRVAVGGDEVDREQARGDHQQQGCYEEGDRPEADRGHEPTHALLEPDRRDGEGESAEREILEAWCKARFSLYGALRVVPGVGVYVRDLLRQDDEILVVDRGLALSREGFVLACRLVFFPEFAITTGAGIPIAEPAALQTILEALSRRFGALNMPEIDQAPDGARSDLFFLVVRTLLALHQTRHVEYADNPEQVDLSRLRGGAPPGLSRGPVVPERSLPRVGRNEPCPCGSGRKYKKCHGA